MHIFEKENEACDYFRVIQMFWLHTSKWRLWAPERPKYHIVQNVFTAGWLFDKEV